MQKRIYRPLEPITYSEALKLLKTGGEEELLLLPLRAGEYIELWREAQDICIRLMNSGSPRIRCNAVLGLSYATRIHGVLDKRIVKPYLLRELRENTEYKEYIEMYICDINMFLNWKIGRTEDE